MDKVSGFGVLFHATSFPSDMIGLHLTIEKWDPHLQDKKWVHVGNSEFSQYLSTDGI